MNIENEILCKVCNQKQEMIDHELTVIPFVKEGMNIGLKQTQKVCNVRFYCNKCKVNMSQVFPYEDERIIPAFIEDVQKFSVKFKNQEYMEI